MSDEEQRLTAEQHKQFDTNVDLDELSEVVKDHQDINNMGDQPDAPTVHERLNGGKDAR